MSLLTADSLVRCFNTQSSVAVRSARVVVNHYDSLHSRELFCKWIQMCSSAYLQLTLTLLDLGNSASLLGLEGFLKTQISIGNLPNCIIKPPPVVALQYLTFCTWGQERFLSSFPVCNIALILALPSLVRMDACWDGYAVNSTICSRPFSSRLT